MYRRVGRMVQVVVVATIGLVTQASVPEELAKMANRTILKLKQVMLVVGVALCLKCDIN